jgi:RHS repeat-associated protein
VKHYGKPILQTPGSTHKDFDDYGLPKTIITGNVQDLEYSFDPVTGNLNYRKDHIFNLVENFEYDNLLKTRLIEWEVYGLDNYSIEYENNGNIHIKTDVTNIQTLPKGEYVYGQNAGQHAVTSIFKPTEEYLLKATPVIEHDKTHIYRMDISYGPYQKRKATQFYKDKTLLSSKCFIGDNYEIETERDGTKRKLHYLSGGDGLFAIYESKDGENKMYYIHKDYLGSYETVTDEQGVIWDKLSFDPWGRRRNPFTWLYEDTPIPAIFDRGYTGHEHLDKFELINMGGRVYDPVLARFLSPDPFVQAPEYGQNYNRYSYAFNNPLKFTDPNGEFGFLIFVGLSALMSAALSGSQPDGSFDWGEAGKGAFIGVAMPVGMMGSVLAPFSPALLGVSGALGSAAIAGSAMFGSVTLTTGATSFATNGTFSPNLKAAGISAGITALFAGIEGGIRAANDNRNFWTGEIEIDPFIIGKQDVQSSYLNTAQKYNSSAARETHDKLLKLRYEDTFSFKDGDFDISKLTTGTSRKIGYTPSGSFINTKTGELYAGYFNRATKAIHISLKTLFSKEIIFKSIAGHELIHAYHHSIIPNMLSLYTERVAYQYTYNVLMMGGEYNKAASKFWYMSIKGYFGEYPASYNLPTYYSFW